LKEFKGFKASGMSCGGVIMMELKKFFMGIWGNIGTVTKVEDTIGDMPIT